MDFKLPLRAENSHKGTFGKVLNVSGSKYMTGAAVLSSVSALKSGCGYVFLAASDEVIKSVSAQTQAIVFLPYKKIEEVLSTSQAFLFGCGLSTENFALELAQKVFSKRIEVPTVIDADGLNILAMEKITHLPKNLILTPHPLEASRLLGGIEVKLILENTEHWAKEITQKYNCVTVLKTHKTVVTSPEGGVYHNESGNSAMAKAGSGDVLAGMMTSFLAQGVELFEAAKLAVYLHGVAGDIARDELSAYCVLPTDLIDKIPNAFKTLLNQ